MPLNPRPERLIDIRQQLIDSLLINFLELLWEPALAAAYRAKQRAVPATPLPLDFPFREALAKAQYMTKEDLTGASADELVRLAEFTLKDAQTVLNALGALP